ncbi:ankyrin repeat protein [Treponema sp. R8-4-B8]
MKTKLVLGVLAVLLLLQAQTVFADDYDNFINELNRNNIGNIEKLLQKRAGQMDLAKCMYGTIYSSIYAESFNKANCLDVLRLLVRYGADVNRQYKYDSYYPLENAVFNKHSFAVIQFLLDAGANPNRASSFMPVRKAYSNKDMPVVNLLLDRGANGEEILPSAASNGDNQMIRQLISRGVQIRSEAGADALRRAAFLGKLDTVKLLVENGVNVNARANNNDVLVEIGSIPLGATAASLAYDKGEIEIYNYLKANGAIDFEPRQVVQQPSAPAQSSSNYTPPPSSSSGSSSQSQSSGPSGADVAARVVGDINSAFQSPLENGRYRISGRPEEISFAGIAKSGMVYYKDAAGTQNKGTYSIDGDRLTINVMNRSYIYSITSKTSFSGNGEAWYRVGF